MRGQDCLYVHDAIDVFAPNLAALRQMWRQEVRPALPGKTARTIEERARQAFVKVTDAVREAARIPQDRNLRPDGFRELCEAGLIEICEPG
jgi:hypothetical protein